MKKSARIFALLGLLILLGGLFPISHISVSSGKFHCVVRSDNFSLRWRHSVEKQLWFEHYRTIQGRLELYESWLETFGAGTPSQAEFADNVPQGYVGYKHQVWLDELNWTVSPKMEGSIRFGKKWLEIYRLLPEYSSVNIKPARSPLGLYLLRRSCNV